MISTDLSFDIKEYQRRTLGLVVRGSLYDSIHEERNYALSLIAEKAPENCVIIPSTIKTKVDFVIEMPHKDCKAEHAEPKPKWYTSITVQAFPDVCAEHRSAVQSLGKNLTVVRVPIMKELKASDYIR